MTTGRLLAIVIAAATVALIVVGTLWPIPSAIAMAGSGANLLRPSSSPQAAVENLAGEIGQQAWAKAYSSLANKNEFTEVEFVRDLTGSYPSLRSYATLESFDLRPLHASADEAQVQLKLRWSSVVGTFLDTRTLRVVRTGDRWGVSWPIVKEPRVPPQVIPVNYLRWDVIYRGPEDDWGAQDVEAPHVRIVDMHPVDRSAGVVIMGELLNEDVVPAFVTVKATLLAKDGSAIASEDSFDKISHVLLPKQVTPFLIAFHDVALSQVDSVHMDPSATLIAASADPVIEIEDQHLNPAPGASLNGKLVNQSGQVVNVAHVLGTFYDKNGQLVWVADQYVDRALLPQMPVTFAISIPADISSKVSSERAIATTYSSGRFQ
ncbi:MAG TPA: hypothetical protein VKR57_13120 [Terriglobales bacterium]|nr:hypothetical protein [Terriglobales bacterium]